MTYPAGHRRSITADSFARLLDRLHPDAEQAAHEYERLRRALVKFFDWRGASPPDECADEALDRLAHKLAEITVQDVRKYVYGIARMVAFERRRAPAFSSLDEVPRATLTAAAPAEDGSRLHDCFDRCLGELPEDSRSLLLRYYEGEQRAKISNRRRLASMLGLTENALRSRVPAPRPPRAVCPVVFVAACEPNAMNATPESVRARRYLLRQASDEECAVLEQEYLEHEEAVDRMAGAEDDLIEDYLAARLSAADRERFERAYLSAPHHRVRVETIRRLMAQPGQPGRATGEKVLPFSPKRLMRHGAWLALAASLLVVASAALWMSSSFRGRPPQIVDTGAPQPPAPVAPNQTTSPSTPPRAFAVTLPPVSVRSASENASVVIPAGTGTVTIRLESDPDNRTLTAHRASLRTIGGREVWQGPLTPDGNPPGVIARIDVPAATVPPDDYLVTLFGTDRAGAERELAQYFLRVRGR